MKKLFSLSVLTMALLCPAKNLLAQQKPVARMDHLAILVDDLQKATDFYKTLFGLEIVPEPFHDGKHTWFSLGNGAYLHVIKGPKTKEHYEKNEHLCFSVASVEEFVKSLRAKSIKFENAAGKADEITARVDGVKQIYFQDTDGHWLEVNDAK